MRIQPVNRKVNVVMALDEGDIFKYMDDYYVAGEINMLDNCRECFNLSKNIAFKMHYNPAVEYWHGDDVILTLNDKEC